ncbi:epsin-2 [Zerene cesonia]|uniref:epsin-2 n=1 Tax=Zerene cesonia TaxID=33412 RepID=UPI0018E5939C|nr:epsin-2 [Zerene cesonia]
MQVNVAGLRRNIKNLAHNYSDAQVKVREATSNDPWGPSSTLMAEIADLTYNVMAFTEIMQMIWKRLNDHGKNWRHVYKALVLMEYLIKTGSEKVAMQCKENIFAIHTLKDFQYMEEGKDQGLNVREKAKQLVHLLKDEERLKNERARALKAKQRFAQSASAFGSDGALDRPSSPTYPALGSGGSLGSAGVAGSGGSGGSGWSGREAELARPLTAGEEELQLQLALAMSREEAEREERRRRSDDVRLQLAISQSQNDFQSPTGSGGAVGAAGASAANGQQSHLLDLLDVTLPPEPWPQEQKQPDTLDVSIFSDSMDTSSEAWSGVNSPARDPWAPLAANANPDPWAPLAQSKSPVSVISSPSSELEQFDALSQRPRDARAPDPQPDPFDLSALNDNVPAGAGAIKKSPSAFLGENSSLVNLERLLPPAPNPFAAEPPKQMFATPQPLSINEIKQQQMGLAPNLGFQSSSPAYTSPLTLGGMAPLNNTMAPLNNTMAPLNNTMAPLNNTMAPLNNTMAPLSNTMAPLNNTMAPLSSAAPLGTTMAPLGNNMAPLANSMAPIGSGMPLSNSMGLGAAPLGAGLGSGAPTADPWAPARSSSPWSPPPTRHTPNPFLS